MIRQGLDLRISFQHDSDFIFLGPAYPTLEITFGLHDIRTATHILFAFKLSNQTSTGTFLMHVLVRKLKQILIYVFCKGTANRPANMLESSLTCLNEMT